METIEDPETLMIYIQSGGKRGTYVSRVMMECLVTAMREQDLNTLSLLSFAGLDLIYGDMIHLIETVPITNVSKSQLANLVHNSDVSPGVMNHIFDSIHKLGKHEVARELIEVCSHDRIWEAGRYSNDTLRYLFDMGMKPPKDPFKLDLTYPCDMEALTIILDNGYDISSADEHGYTALHFVRDRNALALLLERSNNADPVDHSGRKASEYWKEIDDDG